MNDEISLRPIVLRPAGMPGGNPFTMFSKGSGQVLKSKLASKPEPVEARPPKRDEDRVKYAKDFLMQFMDKHTQAPIELQQQSVLNAEIIISEESEKDKQREALQKAVVDDELPDDRDWRSRTAAPASANGGDGGGGGSAPAVAPTKSSDARWESKAQGGGGAAKREAEPALKSAPAPKEAPATKELATKEAAPIPRPGMATAQEASKIQKAADTGKVAYRPGVGTGALSAEERATRQVKGILNKLTPEKFERLLQQLLSVVTTAEVLRATIALVFENAVEQPTYCAMYADLCKELSKELPSFPPPAGSDKPLTFIQILLNTCQDEFEGAEEAKEALASMVDPAQREDQERMVKKRILGTMRLISELYKQDMVRDWIITACMESLLAKGRGGKVSEDSVEAACEVLSTAGAKIAANTGEKMQRKLEEVLRQLASLEKDKSLSSRIRFVVRDVLDLRRNNWVPRREAFTAKKLDEVRAQAEAELGMVSTATLAASLPSLPALPSLPGGGGRGGGGRGGMGGGGGGGGGDEGFALIPPLREGDTGGWGFSTSGGANAGAGSGGGAKFSGGGSALLGDYRPPQATVTPVGGPSASTAAAPAEPKPAAAAAAKPAGPEAPEEELKRKTESLLAEYASTLDTKEALACVEELGAPEGYRPRLIEAVLEVMMNSLKDKECAALEALLLAMVAAAAVSPADVTAAIRTYTSMLEDLALDVPKAPRLLGGVLGAVVSAGALDVGVLPTLLEGDSGVEPKRDFAAAALRRFVASGGGAAACRAACEASGVKASAFLAPDELDGPDCQPVDAWLAKETLADAVPL